jgi:hypothetical protein
MMHGMNDDLQKENVFYVCEKKIVILIGRCTLPIILEWRQVRQVGCSNSSTSCYLTGGIAFLYFQRMISSKE